MHAGLDTASTHTYRVRAVNGANTGDWSGLKTKATLPGKPPTPGNIIITPSNSEIMVTFGSVTGADFDVEFDNVVIDNGNSTTFAKTGLGAGTQHSIRVRSKNAGGTSDWSSKRDVLRS